MRIRWGVCVLCLAAWLPSAAQAQYHTERGAVLGGLVGALAGAGIGDHNDNAGAGALIGGAVGLVSGAALGNTVDREQSARMYAAQSYQQQVLASGVSTVEVVSMTQNGVSDEVIINHVRQNGVQRRLEVADVISLHRQGVSELVISAMQQAPLAGSRPAVQPVYRQPVVVEEHYYAPPPPRVIYHYGPPCPPRYYHHYHHHHHPHSGVSVGFTFR